MATRVQPGIELEFSRRLNLRSVATAHAKCTELQSSTARIASQYVAQLQVLSKKPTAYRRPQATLLAERLAERLAEPRRFLHVVAGRRQVGKFTLVQQVTCELGVSVRYVSADEPTLLARFGGMS